jgi:ABC-type lipoprotein release transport system permease subunit
VITGDARRLSAAGRGNQKFTVKPTDPAVFAIVGGALMLVAMAASLAPSVRVARIRPAAALRVE